MARPDGRRGPSGPADDGGDAAELFAPPPLPIAPLDDESRIACLRLIRSENVGPVTFRELINHFGGAVRALEALPDVAHRAGRNKPLRLLDRESAVAELEAAQRVNAVPVFTIEPGYPPALAEIGHPPPLVYLIGAPGLLARPSVAIVGSRDCSAAGTKLARRFAAELGAAGLVVVSGLARGIDGAAHEAALATGTVAVLAGGVDTIYPPEHAGLHAAIAAEGCLVSESPPGFQPRAQDFPRRNRIISGLSRAVVVMEAARRSGTLVTARYALEQNREVFAVPGHPLDPRAEGTNALLKRQEATLALSAADVLDVLGPITGMAPVRVAEPQAAYLAATPDGTGGQAGHAIAPVTTAADERDAVVRALGPHPIDIDEIVRATGLPPRTVQIAVMELDLAGRIERHGGQLVSLRI